jgi:tetratricopeptide (TPR) repeat protein
MPSETKFPHFIRKIHASPFMRIFDYFLWYLVIFLVLFNLFHTYFFPFNEEKRLERQIIVKPFEVLFHDNLGQYYLAINYQAANREFFLAQKLYEETTFAENKVLGTQSSPAEIWASVISQKQKLEKELDFWEKINKAFPDYLYTKAKIATLAYQLGDKDKTQKWLNLGLSQSPKDELLLQLTQKLNN